MSQRYIVDSNAMLAQGGNGAFQIHGIPECDGRDDQIQAAGTIALVLETPVTEVALAVEEDGPRESVSGVPSETDNKAR